MKNLTWQNPEQLFVAQELINKVKSKCCGIKDFKNAYGNNAIASLLLDFAQKHMPDLLADIKNGHNEVYEKRHQRIEEKKAVLLVQEQAKQEAEQSDKQQSEVGMQTEEQPQEEDIVA